MSQWGEVKKKTKERSQLKTKESSISSAEPVHSSSRGGRGRGGAEGTRGRGRGSERGRGTGRGGRGAPSANGPRKASLEKAVEEGGLNAEWDTRTKHEGATGTWDQQPEPENAALESSWENINSSEVNTVPIAEAAKPSLKPDGTRSWASMFSKPAQAPIPSTKPPKEPTEELPSEQLTATPPKGEENGMPALPPPIQVETVNPELPNTPPSPSVESSEPPLELTPSKDELTETNLEQVVDDSGPANTATAASTVASTIDARTLAGTGTPLPTSQPGSRPPMGGYATTAYKATGMAGRSASFQRKILEQQEAVVMPGKHAVDRAAVQFGSMGLNGTAEDLDVDDDREEPETRTQPPQHSPIAPRAALPPSHQQGLGAQSPASDPLPTPRQAPGLPPLNQQPAPQQPPQSSNDQSSQAGYPYNQFSGRYGPQQVPEPSAPVQKPYEPFGSQIQQPQHHDGYPTASQAQSQPHQQQIGGFSSAPQDMSSYYTAESQRNAFQNYYANYGQHSQQSPQDSIPSQNRATNSFGVSNTEQNAQYATSQAQQQASNRYAQASEAHTSGTSTPNPSIPSHGHQNQPQHMVQQQQTQGQGAGQHGAYPYGHPYYPSPYYSAYMNQVSAHPYGRERPMFDDVRRYDEHFLTHKPQFGYGGSQSGYGGSFGGGAGKQGVYGQPHQGYGMSPQTPYDQHTSSPANLGGFGQQHSAPGREGATSANVSNYNRSSSTQPSEPQQNPFPGGSAGGYNSGTDAFGRPSSNYQSQNHSHQQAGGQQGGNEDSLRAFVEPSKVPGGPSPAPGMRPTSAVNSSQGLPPPQSQQGYAGYPGHLGHQMHGQQGSQFGTGPGGLGGHHQSTGQPHQGSGYGGAYGAGFGGNYYGGNSRGGWGGNYGH